jgi:hypothetical protein
VLASGNRTGHYASVRWVVVLGCIPLFAYGALNVVLPRTTARWQTRATARHDRGDMRRTIGETAQQAVGVKFDGPDSQPPLGRVRLLGLAEIVVAAIVIGAVIATR